jgi:hypothetical protein
VPDTAVALWEHDEYPRNCFCTFSWNIFTEHSYGTGESPHFEGPILAFHYLGTGTPRARTIKLGKGIQAGSGQRILTYNAEPGTEAATALVRLQQPALTLAREGADLEQAV